MDATSRAFVANARAGLGDAALQRSLARFQGGFTVKRREAAARLPEFEALRDRARAIKDHTLAALDHYLERFEEKVAESGGTVHWCRTPAEARAEILALCRAAGARTVTKSKSMIAEELDLNPFLEAHGIEPVETDLGEYIVQLAGERPSHIIAPAVHKTREQVADLFREKHGNDGRGAERIADLVEEARRALRPRYLAADVGITGANFLVAETGSSVVVTNEGNADLTQLLPRTHIVIATLEKVCPPWTMRRRSCGCWRARPPARSSPPTPPSRPAPAGPATPTARPPSTWCCWTTAARACWARPSRTRSAASNAAPA